MLCDLPVAALLPLTVHRGSLVQYCHGLSECDTITMKCRFRFAYCAETDPVVNTILTPKTRERKVCLGTVRLGVDTAELTLTIQYHNTTMTVSHTLILRKSSTVCAFKSAAVTYRDSKGILLASKSSELSGVGLSSRVCKGHSQGAARGMLPLQAPSRCPFVLGQVDTLWLTTEVL
jgi:hypothetical protein